MKTIKFVYLIILFLFFSKTTWSQSQTNSNAEQILQEVIALANKVPLSELMKNPTFAANWPDAKNLQDKKVELGKKKTLTPDEKTIVDMAEYASFKEFPDIVKIDFMRAYLSAELDMKYLATDTDGEETRYVIDDAVVWEQYKQKMEEIEEKMENTKNLVGDEIVNTASDWEDD